MSVAIPALKLLLVAAIASQLQEAAAQSELANVFGPVRPITVAAPAFPAGSSAPAPGVRVDVVGTVSVNGEFKPTAIASDGEDQERFVNAVSEVLRWWRFVPAVDMTLCVPKEEQSKFSIWFEGSDAAPRVFVSYPTRSAAPVQPPVAAESIYLPEITYPRNLLGVEGQVQVLHLISPEGKVKSATVRSSTPYGAFDSVVLNAARRIRVTWKEPRPTTDVCAERAYVFCTRDAVVSMPFSDCESSK